MLTDKWINDVLHRIVPLVLLLDWLFVAMAKRLRPTPELVGLWLIFPVLYGVYSLIRGPIVDWYPYPSAVGSVRAARPGEVDVDP